MTVQTAFDTLFLDRDGVINVLRPHDYVKSWDEFEFTDGAIEALRMLSPLFRHIVVVTNQRGVGKGVMTEEALRTIHRRMIEAVAAGGGRIDAVYYCADRNEDSPNRKPNTGMALQARRDFPDIDFSKTILVGDSGSDMEFGRRIGARTVLIHPDDPSAAFGSLYDFFAAVLRRTRFWSLKNAKPLGSYRSRISPAVELRRSRYSERAKTLSIRILCVHLFRKRIRSITAPLHETDPEDSF